MEQDRNLFEIFSEIESRFITNRRQLLLSGADGFKGNVAQWRNKQLAALPMLRQANATTLKSYADELGEYISGLNTRAFKAGIDRVDKAKGDGVFRKVMTASLIAAITSMLTQIGGAERIAMASSEQQYFEIVAKTESLYNGGGDILPVLDFVSHDALNRGLVGAVSKNYAQANIATLASAIEANGEISATRTAEGERLGQYGITLLRISAHPRSCELCYPWQDQVLINDVTADGKPDGKHELLSVAVAAGLFHYNCRHNFIAEGEGADKIYKREIQPEDKNAENYNAQQEQRHNERMIRQWKRREAGALTQAERDNARQHVAAWQGRQRELIKEVNARHGEALYRQATREQIGGETKPKTVLTTGKNGDIINIREKVFNLSYEEAQHLKEKMTNEVARNFYVSHIGNLDKAIDKTLPIEEQAKQAFEMRNEARSFTRELMADRELAENLSSNHKNYTWEKMIEHKIKDKGLTGDKTFEDIIKTAKESNKSVDKEFGIRR